MNYKNLIAIVGGLIVLAFVISGCGDDEDKIINGPNNTPPPITNIQLTPPSPATLMGGDTVKVSFDYTDIPVGGANIYAQPYPLIRWSGSPLYPEGSGVGRGWIMVNDQSTPGRVDSIVFQIVDPALAVLYDSTMYVDYEWLAPIPTVSNIQLPSVPI